MSDTLAFFGGWSIHGVANVKIVRDKNHHCVDIIITPNDDLVGNEISLSLWGINRQHPTVTVDVSNGQLIAVPREQIVSLDSVS